MENKAKATAAWSKATRNQKDLDHATETLSEYLERDIKGILDWNEIKQKVQDKTR